MKRADLIKVKTIDDYHRLMGHDKPLHPLISLINLATIKALPFTDPVNLIYDFYCITLKKYAGVKFTYGQQDYDFKEGTMFFMSPMQVFGFHANNRKNRNAAGWALLIHPDFLWNTSLATRIKKFEYFEYSVNEALHISDKEEHILNSIVAIIEQEYKRDIDGFSHDIIITQIDSLLTYADRFYQRQFITRKKANHDVLIQLEKLLVNYFKNEGTVIRLPTVQFVASQLHLSPSYLSRLLTTLTGKSTKEFIQEKLIEIAKEKLSTTDLSIKEIAFQLGFEHSQSFTKLFKAKTSLTPVMFRTSFN